MKDKVKIKQEIERLKIEYTKESIFRTVRGDTAREVLDKLLSFIDSLPEEHTNEDLEEEVINFLQNGSEFRLNDSNYVVDKNGWIIDGETAKDFARHFTEWQEKQMLGIAEAFYEQGRFEQKQEMMKDAVETTIVNDWQYGKDPDHAIITAIHQRISGFNVGDKVKFIILKTEQL